ncbi:MAG: hypothetical protein K6E37_10365 [Bacteroidales bacterium]|nr:hypothetical protein [Bacteroidales bacterium]
MSKKLYEQPTTKVLVVRFGGVLCGSDPAHAYHLGGAGTYSDPEELYDNGEY